MPELVMLVISIVVSIKQWFVFPSVCPATGLLFKSSILINAVMYISVLLSEGQYSCLTGIKCVDDGELVAKILR